MPRTEVGHKGRRRRRGDRVAESLARGKFAARLDRMRIPVRMAYVGILLLATLSSLSFDPDPDAVGARFSRMLRPALTARDIVDGARNLALFMGWGLLWMLTAPAGRSRSALRDAILSAAALSLSVECMQIFSGARIASVLDLATNIGGAAAGALVLVVAVMALARRSDDRSFVGVPASIFAFGYGAAVLGEASVPLFREALVVSGGPPQRFASTLDQFRWESLLHPPLGDFLIFLPAGFFGVAALYEAGLDYRRAARRVGLGAVILFSGLEVAHGALGIPIHAGAALIHFVGVACGAALAAKALPTFSREVRGADRPRLLTLAYVSVLVLWAARPYAPETTMSALVEKLTSEWWIPLRSLSMRMDMFSVVDVFAPFLLYASLGALLAVWPLRLRGYLSGVTPALYLALATEITQTLVAERTLDVTDFMIQASGAAVGWVAVRRAGFRQYGAQLPQPAGRSIPRLEVPSQR